MQPSFGKASAFTPVKKQKDLSDYYEIMKSYGAQILENGDKIRVLEHLGLIEMPFFLRLLINTVFYLLTGCESREVATSLISQFVKNPLSIKIKISLLRVLVTMVQKRLCVVEPQRYSEQISFCLMFKVHLLSFILTVLSEHSDYVRLDKVQQFYSRLVSEGYLSFLPEQMFLLYGGSSSKIAKKQFSEKLHLVTLALAQHFSSGQNLIMRNGRYVKQKKEYSKTLDELIPTIANFQNKNYLKELIENAAQRVFGSRQMLTEEEFLASMRAIIENEEEKRKYCYVWLYFDLLRFEFQLLDSKQLQSEVVSRENGQSCNYYHQQMQKILKKCPYNGHESCCCKKCQCVRRNRESAKLSQEKKRNALEQVGLLQERIFELEKEKEQVGQLRERLFRSESEKRQVMEQNSFLIAMINEIKGNPEFKNIMRGAAEKISKVLKNQ